MNSSDNMDAFAFSNRPVNPLPNPGEGGPVSVPDYGVGGSDIPGSLLPGPGAGGPVDPGNAVPVVPLPNPGQGGPVAPGRPNPIIPVFPEPNPPCYFCTTGRYGKVRFLNAATGYRPFRVFLNNRYIVNGLGFASLTPYGRVSNGFQTVTVTGQNGYVYLQKSIPFRSDDNVTVAIINTASGLDLMQISDTPCVRPNSMSCFRVCNLAYYANPVDVILQDGRVVYSDVRYKEVTSFKRIRPGSYQLYLAETNLRPMPRFVDIETAGANIAGFSLPEALVSFYVDVRPNAMYTVYIFSRGASPDALQTMVVEDR